MFRLRFVAICFILLTEMAFIVLGCLRIWEALSARERVHRYESDLDRLRVRYDTSVQRLRYVRSDRYIEDVARRDLGLSLEGEKVFMVSEKAVR